MHSYSAPFDLRMVLHYWGSSFSSTEHAVPGGIHMNREGRGLLPSQPVTAKYGCQPDYYLEWNKTQAARYTLGNFLDWII